MLPANKVKFLSNDIALYFTDSNQVRTTSKNKYKYIVKQYNVLHVSASRFVFSYLYEHWKNYMSRACRAYGERRSSYRILVGKPEGGRPLGRPRPRWEDNINMDLQEVGCGGMDWIELAQDWERCRDLSMW
jgi:hypothetical protein